MNHGTYVGGWRFDWEAAAIACKGYEQQGRMDAYAAAADPGVVMCPQCGEYHWREYEVFLCARCGAEVTDCGDYQKAGYPSRPEARRKRLFNGMRVKYLGREVTRRNGTKYMASGMWPAGEVMPGTKGIIRKVVKSTRLYEAVDWEIDFEGMTPDRDPQTGEPYVFGTFGPFLGDEFREIDEYPF